MRARAAEAKIERGGERHAAADARPLDGRDRHLLHVPPGPAHARADAQRRAPLPEPQLGPRPAFRVLEVEARREHPGVARQDHHRGRHIVLEGLRGGAKLAHRRGRERIDGVAAVEPHHGDAALGSQPLLDADESVAHGALRPCTCRRQMQAGRQNLEPAGVRLLPGEPATADAPAVCATGPAERRRNMDEADAAAGRVPRAAQRVIERGVAQIAAGVARYERRDAQPAQPGDDVLHRQARGHERRPSVADRSPGRQGARSIGRGHAGIAGASLDLEAARARRHAEMQHQIGRDLREQLIEPPGCRRPLGRQHLDRDARTGKLPRRGLRQLRHQPHGGIDRHPRKRPEAGDQHGGAGILHRRTVPHAWRLGNRKVCKQAIAARSRGRFIHACFLLASRRAPTPKAPR